MEFVGNCLLYVLYKSMLWDGISNASCNLRLFCVVLWVSLGFVGGGEVR